MTASDIRLECMRQAIIAKKKSVKIALSDEDVASAFADFARGEEIRLKALEMSVSMMKARVETDSILCEALRFLEFASDSKKEQKKIGSKSR